MIMIMKYIYGIVLIAWLAIGQITNSNTDILGIASLLGVLCLFIIKERYFTGKEYASFVFWAIALLMSQFKSEFILLSVIPMLDFAYYGKYFVAGLVFMVSFFLYMQNGYYSYVLPTITAALYGYIAGMKDKNEKHHISVLDDERRLRYHLELIQNELVSSRKEIEHLTEIRERNRIAHEIHDNIGHSIAGVIFQLEAAIRIFHKDQEKSESILKLCSQKLTEALELTRNTVYNIRVDKKTGLDSIEKIINDFNFCPVTFEHSGDFNLVSASNIKILAANIMECLTNASKYSKAASIQIKLDIGKKNIRFYYMDDGVGCKNIHERIGISGMRDRVRNAGGTISIDGNSGFLIVCNLPMENGNSEVE
jgi:signal transduction histidine kinase